MSHLAVEDSQIWKIAQGSPCVGRIVSITREGEALVDYPGNQIGPIHARLAVPDSFDKPGQSVLLIFENQDPTLPIIAGVIRDKVSDSGLMPTRDKDELVLRADKELTLVCGKSSVTLVNDGRIIVKGAEIMSRASGTNKIRGASVKIN